MQQISFDGMTAHMKEVKFEKKCTLCNMNCKTHRGCLIGQIMNEVNKERKGTKYKPVSFPYVSMKFPKAIPDADISYAISSARDSKRRTGYPFSKAIFGMIKPK